MARSKKELSGKMRKRMVQIILAALAAGTLAVTVPTALPGSRAEAASVQLAGGTTVDAVAVAGIVADGCTGTLLVLDTEIGTFRIVLDTNTQYGTTVIVVTNDRSIVDRMNKRVIEMKQGEIIRDDPARTEEEYDEYYEDENAYQDVDSDGYDYEN